MSGRSNYIRYLCWQIQKNIFRNPVEAYVIDGFEQKLKGLQDYGFVEHYTTEGGSFEMLLEQIERTCERRANRCMEEGIGCLEEEPLLLVVVNNKGVYDSTRITKEACNQWKNIIKTYKAMKVLFVFSSMENVNPGIGASEILKFVKENKNILYFDELSNLKMTDVPAAVQKQFKNEVNLGDAFYITRNGVLRVRTPLCEEE